MFVNFVIIILGAILGTHTHFNLVFYFQVFINWEEAQLGLVLVTRGLFSSGLSFISFFNSF